MALNPQANLYKAKVLLEVEVVVLAKNLKEAKKAAFGAGETEQCVSRIAKECHCTPIHSSKDLLPNSMWNNAIPWEKCCFDKRRTVDYLNPDELTCEDIIKIHSRKYKNRKERKNKKGQNKC